MIPGSWVIMSCLIEGDIDAAAALAASGFRIESWGEDAEAAARLRALAAELATAARFTTLLRA
jgi:chaperone required for assembly of F1-ATPase